jgi:hypothetical protein
MIKGFKKLDLLEKSQWIIFKTIILINYYLHFTVLLLFSPTLHLNIALNLLKNKNKVE